MPSRSLRHLLLVPAAFVLAASLPLAVGCGDDPPPPPADVHGSFTMSVTNGPSTCSGLNWQEGQTSANIPVTIVQEGSSVTADVGGVQGAFLDAAFGASSFEGSVSGADLTLTLTGTRSLSAGSCAYTIDGHLTAHADGDVMRGSIDYVPNTNSSPDCAGVRACSARQDFNGTRPPTGG